MLKPQDLLVTLRLATFGDAEPPTFAALAESLSMGASQVFSATRRAAACHLLLEQPPPSTGAARYRVSGANLAEFLISGLRYIFPGELGKPARGFRTAQDAMPLAQQVVRPPGELPIVSAPPRRRCSWLFIKTNLPLRAGSGPPQSTARSMASFG